MTELNEQDLFRLYDMILSNLNELSCCDWADIHKDMADRHALAAKLMTIVQEIKVQQAKDWASTTHD